MRRIATSAVACFLAAALAGAPAQPSRAEQPLKVYYPVPSFSLTDARGQTFTSDSLAKRVWVTNFFFTSCEGPCPITSAKIAKLARQYAEQADVHFVSISVDPKTDTPKQLAAYAERFKADPARWHFLTGETERISEIMQKGFHVGHGDKPTLHSTNFVLVDRAGQIRGYYSGIRSEDIERLSRDISRLLELDN